MEKKRALGKGLSALIPEKISLELERYQEIETAKISPNPYQPRVEFHSEELEELSRSIQKNGLLQPILVVKEAEGYKLVAGERRLRAVRALGWKRIPAIVLAGVQEVELLKKSLVENVQRKNLNPIEEAKAYKRLAEDYGYTLEEIAREVSKDVSTISNAIRLLSLPEEIQEELKQGSLTPGHARALLMLGDKKEIWKLVQEIKRTKISVRETERRAKKVKPAGRDPNLEEVLGKLRRRLGTKVELQIKKKGGKIEIFFLDSEDLERLLRLLLPEGA